MRSAAVIFAAACVALAFWLRRMDTVQPSTTNQPSSKKGDDIASLWGETVLKENTNQPELKFFSPSEFGEWWPYMDPDLLVKLDKFRELIGKPITISGHENAIGRHLGPLKGSYHNVDKHGKVRAVDIFPQGLNSVNAKWYEQKAVEAGLGGIGFYPHWNGGFGMHVDNGPKGRRWAFNEEGKQVGIDHAYA